MQTETLPIDAIQFDPANARKHSVKNLNAIKGSLAKFGQQKPLVIDKNNVVIAGNGTLQAARDLGWDKIDVVRTQLTGPEAIAFALADNRSGELAEWDMTILGETLHSLREINFDLPQIGFDTTYLDQFNTPDFSPVGVDEQGRLDEKKKVACPECGHEFAP